MFDGAPIGASWSGLQLSRVTPRSSVARPPARAITSTSGERNGERRRAPPGAGIGSLRGRNGRRDPERTERPFNAGDPLFYRRSVVARPFYTQRAEHPRESVEESNPERRNRVSRRWQQLGTLFALEEFSAGSRTSRVAGTMVQVGAEKRASSPTAIEVPVRVRSPVSEDALVDGARARGAGAWRGRQGRVPIDGKPAAYVCQNRTCEAPVTTMEALRERVST